jgi:hypothetical protein
MLVLRRLLSKVGYLLVKYVKYIIILIYIFSVLLKESYIVYSRLSLLNYLDPLLYN